METLKEGRWQSRKGGGLQLCLTSESVPYTSTSYGWWLNWAINISQMCKENTIHVFLKVPGISIGIFYLLIKIMGKTYLRYPSIQVSLYIYFYDERVAIYKCITVYIQCQLFCCYGFSAFSYWFHPTWSQKYP